MKNGILHRYRYNKPLTVRYPIYAEPLWLIKPEQLFHEAVGHGSVSIPRSDFCQSFVYWNFIPATLATAPVAAVAGDPCYLCCCGHHTNHTLKPHFLCTLGRLPQDNHVIPSKGGSVQIETLENRRQIGRP